jgi:hypothetical protein
MRSKQLLVLLFSIWLLPAIAQSSRYDQVYQYTVPVGSRHAVQPGQMMVPVKLTEGKPQSIRFPDLRNVKAGVRSVALNAESDAGLPVDYYVIAGPAVIENNQLVFTPVPANSKWPVKVTVVAYQWGRTIASLIQSAEPITKEFYLTK